MRSDLYILIWTIMLAPIALSQNLDPGPAPNVYCGINSLAAAAKSMGYDADLTTLAADERFVTLEEGSSLVQLENAATFWGLESIAVDNVNEDFLKTTPHYVILHVKNEPTAPEYNHFVLFFGVEKGLAKIFDVPKPASDVEFSELLPLMSGKALIVSKTPIELPGSGNRNNTLRYGIWLGGFVVILALIRRKKSN